MDLEKNPDWIIRRMVHWQLIMNQIQSLANPAENSADSQEESQTDVTDDTQGYDDSSLEQ